MIAAGLQGSGRQAAAGPCSTLYLTVPSEVNLQS